MKITLSEQIFVGNFGDNSDSENSAAANNYYRIVFGELSEYISKNWPDAEISDDMNIENASGCARHFEVFADGCSDTDEIMVTNMIRAEFDKITRRMEQSGEVYGE